MRFRRGSILILVLFVLTAVGLVLLSLAYRVALESRATVTFAMSTRLRAEAATAINMAIDRIASDGNDYDHAAESWGTSLKSANSDVADPAGGGAGIESPIVTECSVRDEEGKLHIAFASSAALEKLGMSRSQIESLLDWMDADDTPRTFGAEDGFYTLRLPPHRCKNGLLDLLDELMLVRGFGRADYLGEDTNHNARLDPGEDDGAATWPPDDADGFLRFGWVDLLTCHGDGQINLNTAREPVLSALPLSRDAVRRIVEFRDFDEVRHGQIGEHVFRSAADIQRLQGLTDAEKDLLSRIGCFKSKHFRLFASARHVQSGLELRFEVLCRRAGDGVEILQWKPVP